MTVSCMDTSTTSRVDDLVEPTWRWHAKAGCRHSDLDFQPDIPAGQTPEQATIRQRRICHRHCPVEAYCAVDALKTINQSGHVEGVWGGVACTASNTSAAQQRLVQAAGLPPGHPLAQQLTDKQRRALKVLELHCRHWSAERIADYVGVSSHTVRRDLKTLNHSHLGVGDRCEECTPTTEL